MSFGGGDDFDAVIVTASSESRDLVNSAVAMVQHKGRVVPVGDVVLEIDRGPLYQREADILISTSYGPGRYDTSYEELGIDYPIAYVRWTENRNMAAFLGLIRSGGIDLARVRGARFPIAQAAAAYELVASADRRWPSVLTIRHRRRRVRSTSSRSSLGAHVPAGHCQSLSSAPVPSSKPYMCRTCWRAGMSRSSWSSRAGASTPRRSRSASPARGQQQIGRRCSSRRQILCLSALVTIRTPKLPLRR